MQPDQHLKNRYFLIPVSIRQRIWAGIVFLSIGIFFGLLILSAGGKIDIGQWLGPCGFKQQHGLPCPTCGITSSAIAFASGRIFKSFYIQPAGGLLCSLLLLSAFVSGFIAVSGRNFRFLVRFFAEIRLKYVILVLIFVILCSWAVTLARAIASK